MRPVVGLALFAELSYCREVNQKRPRVPSDAIPIAVAVGCLVVSVLAAHYGGHVVQYLWLALLLCAVIGLLLRRKNSRVGSSVSLLETLFYLSHDQEVFERYQRISQKLLRISQRFNKVYRDLELKSLGEMAATCHL